MKIKEIREGNKVRFVIEEPKRPVDFRKHWKEMEQKALLQTLGYPDEVIER